MEAIFGVGVREQNTLHLSISSIRLLKSLSISQTHFRISQKLSKPSGVAEKEGGRLRTTALNQGFSNSNVHLKHLAIFFKMHVFDSRGVG